MEVKTKNESSNSLDYKLDLDDPDLHFPST